MFVFVLRWTASPNMGSLSNLHHGIIPSPTKLVSTGWHAHEHLHDQFNDKSVPKATRIVLIILSYCELKFYALLS